jgi:hypothetical protein
MPQVTLWIENGRTAQEEVRVLVEVQDRKEFLEIMGAAWDAQRALEAENRRIRERTPGSVDLTEE